MKYNTGELVELSDHVELSGNMTGVIVVIIEDSKYSKSHPKEEWGYYISFIRSSWINSLSSYSKGNKINK